MRRGDIWGEEPRRGSFPNKIENKTRININVKIIRNMVKSKLDSTINYNEKREMFKEDIGIESSVYEIEPFDIPIAVVIGKMKTDKKGKGEPIVYFPIYVISYKENGQSVIKSQIGLVEVFEKDCLSVLDEEKELCLEKAGDPLLYNFVTEGFLKKIHSDPKKYKIEKEVSTLHKKEEEIPQKNSKDDYLSLSVDETKLPEQKKIINEKLKDGIFITRKIDLPILEEETESMANQIIENYRESPNDLWIQKYMKNNHYEIIEVASNGDCLFDVIREAYKSIGKETTISKLRAIVANALTESIFNHHSELYTMYNDTYNNLKKELTQLSKTLEEERQKVKAEKEPKLRKKMTQEANKILKTYNEKVIEYQNVQTNTAEYKHLKDIKTLEEYRKYIMTSHWWADAWAIFVLEQALKMKMIIFGEESYQGHDNDNVINCGYSPEKEVSTFRPEFYIMTTYSGNHYRLVSYKKARILTFVQIPYSVKILIINQCLQRDSGIYNLIQEFRDLKFQMGIEERDEKEQKGGGIVGDLYDSNIVFTYYQNALNLPPGKGKYEKIPEGNLEFSHLATMPDWRKNLDDSWEHEGLIRLDNRQWKSVEHYVLGSQYKKGFPDVYLKFSLDSGSDISKDLALAKKAINLDGVKIDGDKISCHPDKGWNEEKEREQAVRAKFTQNEDLRQLLMYTKKALLKKFIPKNEPMIDMFLMTLRSGNKGSPNPSLV
jgi:predicted NAD-dependent protein-ADP-ribosyltransferase YbiA (DUF1768 family)